MQNIAIANKLKQEDNLNEISLKNRFVKIAS